MKTTLLVVGRTANTHLLSLIADYEQRVRHYVPFDIEVIPELRNTKSLSTEQQKEREGELIRKSLLPGDYIVLLDERGAEYRTIEFAGWLEKKFGTVNKRLLFVIGGPYGFSRQVHKMAQESVSLSKMTFSHQMIRLVFTEQLYRAISFLNGGPYHHE